MNEHSTQYMRSVNDYSLSAHEIFNHETGSRFPLFTRVATIRNIESEEFSEAVETVVSQFTSAGYSTRTTHTINYDDGSKAGEESAYTIYEQRFYTLQKGNDKTSTVILEIYRRNSELIVLTLSSDDVSKYVNAAAEIFRARYKPKPKKQVFYTIAQTSHGFELEEMDIPTKYDEEHVYWHYNDDFQSMHDIIINHIDNNKKGLILLHGLPGAGKTSYIEQLIAKGGERKLVYIPPHLASSIASPAFITFVRDKLSSCVLVIEDAEEILKDREGYADSNAVSNLLNISDGILGKALNILIIATFNMEKQYIDKALLRKGRLVSEYKFGELTLDKANKLVKKLYGEDAELNLGKDEKGDPELRTMGNIFNMEVVQYRTKEVKKSFGFQPAK